VQAWEYFAPLAIAAVRFGARLDSAGALHSAHPAGAGRRRLPLDAPCPLASKLCITCQKARLRAVDRTLCLAAAFK
jgi:hypothetical protein